MTQNNERELIERLALVDIDLRRSQNGFDFIASLSELGAFAKAYKTASDANDESPISQNEQQEAVAYVHPDDLNEMNKIGRCYIFKSSGKGLVPLYTSPPKQAIPEQEIIGYVVHDFMQIYEVRDGYTLMSKNKTDLHTVPVNAAPTNTEVGE